MFLLFIYFYKDDLPADLFSESNGPLPEKGSGKKSRGASGSSGKKKGRPKTDEEKLMQEYFKARKDAVKFCDLSETASNLNKCLRGMKSAKRKLFVKYSNEYCDGNKKEAKVRMNKYFDNKKDERDGDSDDDTAYMLEELLDITMDTQCTATDLVEVRRKKDGEGKKKAAQNPQEMEKEN